MNTATKQSKITNGGTILSVSSSADRAWIGSRAGLFVQTGDQWQPVVREVPFWGVSTLLHADDDLLVAGMPEGLILSADGGKHWRRATIEQTSLPITCLVASPTYRDDDVVLAGTAGDGVLRSSDGGRYWELHNWGMDNLDVLALAVAPDWGRRQFVLASTANGIYRSPNGGRAWQRVQQSPEGVIVPALLFVSAEIVLGGTEASGLIISHDRGRSWTQHPTALDQLTINALLQTNGGTLIAATGEGLIGLSTDQGATWQTVAASNTPILSLGEQGTALLAGLVDDGMLQSADQGHSWQAVPAVAVNRFSWVAASDQGLVAAGPETGIWRSQDDGNSWQQAWNTSPLSHLVVAESHLYAVNDRQVVQFSAENQTHPPQIIFEPNDNPVWLAADGDQLWVGLQGGEIVFRPNSDAAWQSLPVPFKQQTLLGFAISADFDSAPTMLAVTQQSNDLNIWQSSDAGQSWRNTFNDRHPVNATRIVLNSQIAAVSVGNLCFVNTGAGWHKQWLDDAAAPITAIASTGAQKLIAVSADHLHQFDGSNWHSSPHQQPLAIVDLHPTSENASALALTHEGRILRLGLSVSH